MAIPLLLTSLALPGELVTVTAGEMDGDGRDELVLVSRHDGGTEPDSLTLTVVHLDAAGQEEARQVLPLGTVPRFWDIHSGLWLLDGQGVARLELDGQLTRVAELTTPLSGLGPGTPQAADIAHDLDGDGTADVLAWSGGVLQAVAGDGRRWGAIAAPTEALLRTQGQAGGTALVASTKVPALAVADVDGDGADDVLFPEEDQVRIAFTGATVGARVSTATLPLDLEQDDRNGIDRDREERRILGSWWRDLDGDGRVDLLVQRMVTRGSWFGSTAELLVIRGDGSRFTQSQSLETDAAAVDLRFLDFEGDGDLDLLVPQIDVNMGNLASALVSKVVKVEASLYVMEAGRYGEEPVLLRKLKVPISGSDGVQIELEGDVTGDGVVDLVTNEGEQRIRIYPGSVDAQGRPALAEEPAYQLAVTVPQGQDRVLVHDLTGDGRQEIFVWGPEEARGSLLRVP